MKKDVPHEERIARVLKKAGLKRELRLGDAAAPGDSREFSWESVEWRNPLTELMDAEDAAIAFAAKEVREEFDASSPACIAKIRELVFEQFRQFESTFVAWLFDAGPRPLEVVKRLFAYTKYRRPDLLGNMAFRALGDLLNERGATMQARCKALFGELPAGWKKPAEAREHMSQSAIGNQNRRGGKNAPKKSPSKKPKSKRKK